jgi:hypothetical protein
VMQNYNQVKRKLFKTLRTKDRFNIKF